MKWQLSVILFLVISACAPAGGSAAERPGAARSATPGERAITRDASAYPDLGPAPELTQEVWLNTDEPLRLAGLGGKVVLLEMWTFG